MGIFRLLLAMCVLFGHSAPLGGLNWLPGTSAVECFFVISGFYMQLILSEKYTRARLGDGWTLNFYLARYSRLMPTYLIGLVLTCCAATVFLIANHKLTIPFSSWAAMAQLEVTGRNLLLWLVTLLSNATLFFQDIGGILAVRNGEAVFTLDRFNSEIYVWSGNAIPQAWSLGVELLFYISAPFLLNLSNRKLFALCVILIFVKIVFISILAETDLPFRMFPFVLVDFLAGAVAYRNRIALVNLLGKFTPIVAYGLMLVVIVGLPRTLTSAQFSWISLALTVFAVPALFETTKANKTDASIGELSYPFYIFHMLALLSAQVLLGGRETGNTSAVVVAAFAATAVLSYVVMRLEQRYLEPWRQRLGREPVGAGGAQYFLRGQPTPPL